MELKGWAELVHEKRLQQLEVIPPEKRRAQIAKWIREDGIDSDKAKQLWGDYQGVELDGAIEEQAERNREQRKEADRRHRYEYKILNLGYNDDADKVINAHASLGWRLHTFSLAMVDVKGIRGAIAKAFSSSGNQFANVLTIVFERERDR